MGVPAWQQASIRSLQYLLWTLLALSILAAGIWASFALWVQLPVSAVLKVMAITLWWLLSLIVLGTLFKHLNAKCVKASLTQARPSKTGINFSKYFYHSLLVYVAAVITLLVWWQSIEPKQNRQWAADVSRLLQVEQHGNLVTLHNVRNFDWRTPTDFTPRWETRQYDLNKLSSLDVITSYWMGPPIAHVLLSFGFDDGQYLTFSIETRREHHEGFSTIGGFFRMFELSLIAADERDILYTRSNVRGEQVYLYRMDISRQNIRRLFDSYLEEAHELEKQPRFYNTLTSNCTTIVFDMARLIDPGLPLDYRIILSGYLPQYIYEHHGFNTTLSFKQLQRQAYINPYAEAFAASGSQSSQAYSQAIRHNIQTRTNFQ
ncbi:DUF4105 domain-containing protein [Alkanindiges sp. WGS2144]|uniref:Lnb N-terminal periplasmic domain-containing protein n=1 Tax=Alkanindiges sp. WGS2144 TaxID=3366808 RepID=UPI003750ED4C